MRLNNHSLFLLFLCFIGTLLRGADRPNVLLILVDDLKPTIGAYGDSVAVTPQIDRLASEGMRFESAYCNQSVCMASRYNLMLGSRSSSTGFYSFGTQFREVYPDAITLPQHFMNNGYVAHSMGKVFHIGHGNTNDDASWSVPHYKDKVIEYVDPESNHRELTREEGLFTNQGSRDENGKLRPRGAAWESPDVLDYAYADARVAETAVDRLRWLKENEDKPFFMAVGFVRPHLPFSAPKKYWDLYDRYELPMPEFEDAPAGAPKFAVKRGGEINAFKPVPIVEPFPEDMTRQLIHGYYASVSYMDAQVGKVLDGLEAHGFSDDTIVVLWGDHGWHLGDHGSWTKHSNYEQSNRIPIIVKAPGVTKAGSMTQQLAETVDIYPTLASLAGLPAPRTSQPIDGLDMTPVLKDGGKRIREYAYHAYNKRTHLGRALRDERYRIVEWTNHENGNILYELYDYEKDYLETVNIAASDLKALNYMKALLEKEPPAKAQVRRRGR
ncbi:sulfatase [Opitutia bacterium ISCC 51]|nr:sulfatase [Opitutae bacterium ISCC 51]QXD26644.1 sulfatase [Opitutae bacterium ISCC 52]